MNVLYKNVIYLLGGDYDKVKDFRNLLSNFALK